MMALGAGIMLSRHIEATCVRGGYVECVGSVQDFIGVVSLATCSSAFLEHCTLGQYEYCHVSPIPINETSKFSQVVQDNHDKERETQEQGT
jgi:hypothetical protein